MEASSLLCLKAGLRSSSIHRAQGREAVSPDVSLDGCGYPFCREVAVLRTSALYLLLGLTLLWCSAARAETFGVGVILGEPTGLSFKQWVGDHTAIDAAAAWSFGHESAFHVHLDYLIHTRGRSDPDIGRMLFYLGIGGRLKAEEDEGRIGARIPLGIAYEFDESPVDVFFEIAPILDLAPETELRVNGGFGIRYFF